MKVVPFFLLPIQSRTFGYTGRSRGDTPFEVGDGLGGPHRPLRERGSLWTTCKRAASHQEEGGQKNTESMA